MFALKNLFMDVKSKRAFFSLLKKEQQYQTFQRMAQGGRGVLSDHPGINSGLGHSPTG